LKQEEDAARERKERKEIEKKGSKSTGQSPRAEVNKGTMWSTNLTMGAKIKSKGVENKNPGAKKEEEKGRKNGL
jgi:hypothetical protein